MRKVIAFLVDYQRERFEWPLYLTIAAFLAACVYANYLFDFEDTYIDAYQGKPIIWLWMFLFQLLPYLAVCWILLAFGKVDNWIRSGDFWVRVLLGFSILALDRSFIGTQYIAGYLGGDAYYFIAKCVKQSSSLVTTLIPLLMIYWFLEKNDSPKIWYGLSWRKFDVRPYLYMLFLMAVVIGAGSFMSDIQDHYPRFLQSRMEVFIAETNWPKWLTVSIFEFCYGTDFFSVELFFRGYLIFAFTRILGPYVVLPMAATYCFFHFGKPVGEAVSSFFGGYILGVISLNTRNIWGGIMIHLGVAWLMELFGWLHTLR
ncbi:MAG: CPBP family intramembrane glutamic endopeptidase [Cyclobacteriaceae bacterium]